MRKPIESNTSRSAASGFSNSASRTADSGWTGPPTNRSSSPPANSAKGGTTSLTVAGVGRLRTTPSAPSSLCSPISRMVRRKFGSNRLGPAMRSFPRRLSASMLQSSTAVAFRKHSPGHYDSRMRHLGRFAAGLGLVALILFSAAFAGTAMGQGSGERIRDYSVALAIQRDGSLSVDEIIEYDFGAAERHGIFRDIPVQFPYDDRYDRVMRVGFMGVTGSTGTPTKYRIERIGRGLRIKIGDPNRTISGLHSYEIRYRIRGALNGFADHDELYWNAIGADWDVPIDRASVRVTAPGEIQRVACFAGPSGSSLPCASAGSSGATALFGPTSLEARRGLTVVVGFPVGIVVPSPR